MTYVELEHHLFEATDYFLRIHGLSCRRSVSFRYTSVDCSTGTFTFSSNPVYVRGYKRIIDELATFRYVNYGRIYDSKTHSYYVILHKSYDVVRNSDGSWRVLL